MGRPVRDSVAVVVLKFRGAPGVAQTEAEVEGLREVSGLVVPEVAAFSMEAVAVAAATSAVAVAVQTPIPAVLTPVAVAVDRPTQTRHWSPTWFTLKGFGQVQARSYFATS
jgi:hydroxyethylthiazole kinase-like sugar kinase family protein